MNETKTPKPGEWWLRNRDGRIFYVSGFNPEGWVVHWNEDVGFFSSKMRFFCQEFRHEPRCTGFGWVEPAEIDPGEGYELLPVGRRLERYDQVLASGMTGPTWVDTFYLTERIGSRPGLEGPYRRKIKAVEPPDEVFPKYYILDETKGVCKAPWYIKRTSDKEGLRWGLNCDGVTIGFESQSWGGQSDIWLEVTEAEALARVAIDPDDMPLNPVPGKVVATGTVTTTHVESSDDWVEITDSHPGHIRRLCDQVCDKYARESIHNWHYVKCTVGYSQHAYPMSRIRCRRKNLPVAVPGIKRVPVRLWINEEDGWLFASPDQLLASDQEILHDADGFFVEPPAIDPNDIPLNPVPGKVVATGTVKLTPVTPTACVACGVNWALDGSVSCRECYEHAIEATGCPVKSPDNMAAIIAEHTQQVRELTQRIGELVQQVNERDALIEKIRRTCELCDLN